ncbi:3-oxoacyl-[acyl-carrier-protein] synthase II [Aquimarina sp. EL_43]|uniref:beta-ketoacyl-ACP synthase II n=1 Tax=Aquimarina TaxID=290174 RepID=UPI0004712A39|nr:MULTISPECIES: beta-ketoacyl-ACP synthase II [Aquimarina]MBG6131656.1 3-oxoacyl-[acyl-carrier-protein] synthase II [Aquimarina sp. EL_35]MBG6152117.1 3-oxoacyl-[acyl-carrier-protein] synthase II [Aquimarina sp. EL_32]MBG6169939.1 3-oxoacyl-[acyl-carrier-protein] synthase II [Aquimarina sp. EL_43]
MKEKRVVITGLGAITPLGNSVEEFWDNAINAKSGAVRISKFDPSLFKTQFACEVKEFDPQKYLERNEIRKSDLFTQYALYAATEAFEDSKIDVNSISPFDIGVIWGTGQGGMNTFEKEVRGYIENSNTPRFNPFFVPKLISNMASGMISMKFKLMGINYTTVSACATSNSAIMDAYNYIKFGKAKVFITGGSEAPITEASIGGFNAMRAMSTRNDNPSEASRPFDSERDGFVMGEGAGALVIEDLDHAKKRGAKIYAEIIGASMTADAYHMTATHPEGLGAAKAIELALHEAKINPEEVDYLNTHATSTPVGDLSEIKAITKIYGNAPENLKISATKSMTGHLLGAAGAIESILCVKAINEGIVPPTINTNTIAKEIPGNLNIITKEAITGTINIAMNNTFGFGGHNAIAIFKKI